MYNYTIDTSALVNIDKYYNVSKFSQVWDWIERKIKDRIFISTEFVKMELLEDDRDDFLQKWIKTKKEFCVSLKDDDFQDQIAHVSNNYPTFIKPQSVKPYFADPQVVAFALKYNSIVVQSEEPDGKDNPKIMVKIPDVCKHLGIKCIREYQLLNTLDFKL